MNRRGRTALALVAAGMFALGVSGLTGLNWNAVFLRYPDAEPTQAEHYDFDYLSHGWLTRNASYQTPTGLAGVELWYSDQLPGAQSSEVGTCVSLHQATALLHLQRTITVQLCQLPGGTRILVNESYYLAP